MTPRELYGKPALAEGGWLHANLLDRCLDGLPYNIDYDKLQNQAQIVVKVHGFKDGHDGRRYAVLASLWFDDEPFAIVQSAGREGDDHVEVCTTNAPVRLAAQRFVDCELRDIPTFLETAEHTDIADLCTFCGVDFEPDMK